MDMRSKAYPALPEGRGLHLVLPRAGDLRFRPQIPAAFVQRLYIHADPRRRLWYARFHLQRKFIVMSTQGDLYSKTTVSTFTMAELPKQNVLNMPRVSRGDLVKVLDLVQCSRSEGQRWELVFTRWRNGMETWLPLEVVQLYASNLLQEFYVNSINSWAFHSRVQPGNLSIFRTEVELWLFHPEFQNFYKRLRVKRSGSSRPQQQSGQGTDQVHVKPERSTASVNTSHTPLAPHPTQAAQPPVPVIPAVSDPSEAVIREFEQRRITRERQEQREQIRRDQLVQLQQQRAEEQRRLECEREGQRIQGQEQARRVQHELQRQKAHEELQRRQKEYQQRLRARQEREKAAAQQQQDRERQQRATEQERLRQRLQQSKPRSDRSAQKQMHTNRRLQESTARKQLQHKEHQKKPTTHSAAERPKDHNSGSIWSKGGDDEYVPEASESEESESGASSAGSESSDYSPSGRSTRKRRRKRLLYSQVELDDDDDDDGLPDLSLPRRRTRQRNAPQDSSEDDEPVSKPRRNKKRKRLRQSKQEDAEESSGVEMDLTQLSDEEEENDGDSVELVPENSVTASEIPLEEGDNESSGRIAEDLVGDDDDDGDIDGSDFEPSTIVGEIRCGCGATSVGGYRGQWLQCWKEDCGIWEHADCVGFLTSFEIHPPPKYLCTQCDPEAYLARCVKASHRILDWLFQCCDSRNSKQLMDLLEDNTGAANLPPDWKNAAVENRSLAMHAARNGLVKCLGYLLDERKVDLYATDLQSRNVLHHAALGGSIVCCRFLLKRDQKLLLQQDQRGCMAFHLMLQSAKVNRLCVPFMKQDSALVGMGDLDSNFPVHYACQTINSYTVKICRMIFSAQPSMLQEKSSQSLYPLMILCKAARTTTALRNKSPHTNEVCKSVKDIIAQMLNIDVFGDCLNQTGPDGWIPLHFAAASGNHELIHHLCNIGLFDVEYAAKESDQTALHVAAQESHPLCIRALLLEGLNVVAKDADGLIPMLYTEDAACVQEFMHYKLTKQLSRLHRMLGKYQHRGLVRRWQRCVARDTTCFDILNDWCQSDIERIERMEGILLSNPFLLRLDNKVDYVRKYIIPSIRSAPGRCSLGVENGEPAFDNSVKRLGKKKLAFVFSRGSASFWKQFVAMGARLEPENFRLPIVFSIDRGTGNNQGTENPEGNLKLVLIWLAAGLLKAVPGLLVRGSSGGLKMSPLSSDKEELERQLLGFFMLGELVAHFVLFSVPLSGILDFTLPFLRCIGCKGIYQLANDEHWKIPGQSFAAGFEAVLPATLELFHANELRVLFNGPETTLNSLQIDWNTAIEWDMRGSEAVRNEDTANAKKWLPRLMSELVEEEQQLLLLFMTDTFPLVNERFFRSESGSGRITVSSYPESDDVLDNDAMYPTMECKPDVLRLPSYSCYDVFKKGVLSVIRHTNQAFPPE